MIVKRILNLINISFKADSTHESELNYIPENLQRIKLTHN